MEAIEDRQITVIKDRIVNKVKDMENRITMVYVSADVDVVGRLRGYAQDIREGKPISEYSKRLKTCSEELFLVHKVKAGKHPAFTFHFIAWNIAALLISDDDCFK